MANRQSVDQSSNLLEFMVNLSSPKQFLLTWSHFLYSSFYSLMFWFVLIRAYN